MKYRTFAIVAALIALTLAHSVPAQNAPAAPSGATAGGGGVGATPTRDRLDLDFAGGTVVEYLDQIRRISPQANFVIMPGANEFHMPAMQLRNVTVGHLAMLIRETATPPARGGRITANDLGGVYSVQVQLLPPPEERKQPTEPMVISLADVIGEDIRAEDVLTSIETALDLFGDNYPQAEIRFHEATKLLIARGHQHQMMHVMTVVEQLRSSVRVHAPQAQIQALQTKHAELQAAAAQCEQNHRQLQKHADNLQAKVNELERELARMRDN